MRTNRTLVSQSYSTSSESSRRLARITSSLPFIMSTSITSSLHYIIPPIHNVCIPTSITSSLHYIIPPIHNVCIATSITSSLHYIIPPIHNVCLPTSITSSLHYIIPPIHNVCLPTTLLCCVALPCCLFDLVCFFLPSFSSLIKTCNMHANHTHTYKSVA